MENKANYIRTNSSSENASVSGGELYYRVNSNETEDRLGIYDYEVPPKTVGAAVHIHKKMVEIFYVIEGEVSLIIGTEHITGRAGDVILIPRNTIHGFSNKGEKTLKVLIMFTPALSQEGFFKAWADYTKRNDLNSEAFKKISQEYDQEGVSIEDKWLEDFS